MCRNILAAACLLIAIHTANAQSSPISSCVSCSIYSPLIEHALSRGESRALELLRAEIERDVLPDREKIHLIQYIEAAESQIVPEFDTHQQADSDEDEFSSEQVNASVRDTHQQPVGPGGEVEMIDYPQKDEAFSTDGGNAIVRQNDSSVSTSHSTLGEIAGDLIDINEAYRAAGYSLDESIGSPFPEFGRVDAASDVNDPIDISIENAYRRAGYSIDTRLDNAAGPFTDVVAEGEQLENTMFPLPDGAGQHFSTTYLRLRQRYLSYFFFDGMTATTLDLKAGADPTQLNLDSVKTAEFADQTLHMGQALITFAAESSILKQRGLNNSSSEDILRILLAAFQKLDDADELPSIYGVSKPGFFLRDFIHDGARRGVPANWDISSDSKVMVEGGPKHQAAMSLDQAVSLFVGWWGVSRYSSDAANRATAKRQCDRVITFLKDSLFFIKLPNGDSIPSNRGPEFRYAAGFLCRMAEATTGKSYYGSSSIDVTIKGDPIRFRDDNLGEFEIPGYKIPATMRVSLSHPLIVALKPAAVAVMTTPRIKVRFSDLFPGADSDVKLPCAHMEQAHPSGHTNMIPCVHLTVTHSGGDLVATLPCAHMVKKHASDKVACVHMTAQHPGGHDGPTLPCLHLGKLHGSHTKKVGPVKVKVPCTHIGPKHSGGHKQTIPCVHLKAKHPGGHKVPCVHLTAKHPAGHKQYVPCVHPTAVHPGGDPITLPCAHFEQAHPSGHGFDLKSLDIDVPLGEKVHPYTRHIVLQCFAFEPNIDGATEFVPIAISSGHVWSALLRAQVMQDVPIGLLSVATKDALAAMPIDRGPDNRNSKPWTRSNRWERCTDLEPSGDHPQIYNGLDYLGLEVMARLNGIN